MLSVPIGLLFSTTGPYGVVGTAMLNGALVAAEEVNRAGSELRLHIMHADPGGDLARYEPLCRELLDRDVRHIVGCYTSSSRKELIPLVEKRDALLWYPSHYEGFESAPNVIYTGAAPNQHIIPLIGHILQQRGRRVFCIGSNYIWAWENNRILREVLVPRGGTIVGERYLPVGDVDLAQVIEAILEAAPDFVFSTLIGTSAYRFFSMFRAACAGREIDQANVIPILSCSLSEPELVEIDAVARDGHISSSVYFSSIASEENHRFVRGYADKVAGDAVASADAEASYVAVRLLALALAEAGTDDIGPVARKALRQTLQAPQGTVRLDPQTMHAWLTPRIGRSSADGHFDILYEAAFPVQPDPYLVRSMPKLEPAAAPRLRLVS